jgi:hypothetical protein
MKLIVLPDCQICDKINIDLPLKLINWALKHAYQAELDTGRAEILLLDGLDRAMSEFLEALEPALYDLATDRSGSVLRKMQGMYSNESFLALTIRVGLYHYVAKKLEVESDMVDKKSGRPLLQSAIDESTRLIPPFNVSSRMVDLLFRHGASPNQVYKGCSPWQLILGRPRADPHESEEDRREQLKLMRLFLQNGAFVDMNVYRSISEKFKSEYPRETTELQDILISKGALGHENHPEMIKVSLSIHVEEDLDGPICFLPRAAQSFMDSDAGFGLVGEEMTDSPARGHSPLPAHDVANIYERAVFPLQPFQQVKRAKILGGFNSDFDSDFDSNYDSNFDIMEPLPNRTKPSNSVSPV